MTLLVSVILLSVVVVASGQNNQRWSGFNGLQGAPISSPIISNNAYNQNQDAFETRFNSGNRCDLRSCACNGKYIPFCGTDDVTYFNICQLNCAQRCNNQLRVKFEGVCAVPYNGEGSRAYRPNSVPSPTQVTTRPLVVVGHYPVRDRNPAPWNTNTNTPGLRPTPRPRPGPGNPYPQNNNDNEQYQDWRKTTRYPQPPAPAPPTSYPTRFPERFGDDGGRFPQPQSQSTITPPIRYNQWGNRITPPTTPRPRYPQNLDTSASNINVDWKNDIDWRK